MSDPRRLGGSIGGTDDPYGYRTAALDFTNAVLLAHVTVARVEPIRHGQRGSLMIALQLNGRINKTTDETQVLYLLDEDGVASILTELHGVAARSGWSFNQEVLARLQERWTTMPHDPQERPHG
jgi:hypothetical protein